MESRLLACFLLLTATAAAQSDRKFLKSKLATEKHLPFSSAVQVGQTLYIAGTTADIDKLATGLSTEQEARNIMEQIKKTIESAGMTMDDLGLIQVYCTDLDLLMHSTASTANTSKRIFRRALLLVWRSCSSGRISRLPALPSRSADRS